MHMRRCRKGRAEAQLFNPVQPRRVRYRVCNTGILGFLHPNKLDPEYRKRIPADVHCAWRNIGMHVEPASHSVTAHPICATLSTKRSKKRTSSPPQTNRCNRSLGAAGSISRDHRLHCAFRAAVNLVPALAAQASALPCLTWPKSMQRYCRCQSEAPVAGIGE